VPLISDGIQDRSQMRRYLVTDAELLTQVRLQGVASVADVQAAFVEGNGQISVITADDQSRGNQMRGASGST
jgi:uncharacterized membrane protein YcaP (DUF421 family)